MKTRFMIIAAAAALAVSGCVSHNFREGERSQWRCAEGKGFSTRRVNEAVEIYVAGQSFTLAPGAEAGVFSNDAIVLTLRAGRASLTGAYGGPYADCRRGGLLRWR